MKASGGAPATLCSHFVLDRDINLGYTLGQDLLLTRGALARRRSVGAGTVPCACRTQVRVTGGPGCLPLTRDWVEAAADLAVTASGGHRTGIACPPQKAVREAASRLFHQPHASSSRAADRATLDCPKRLGAETAPGPRGMPFRPVALPINHCFEVLPWIVPNRSRPKNCFSSRGIISRLRRAAFFDGEPEPLRRKNALASDADASDAVTASGLAGVSLR